jgi:hypothetical protein
MVSPSVDGYRTAKAVYASATAAAVNGGTARAGERRAPASSARAMTPARARIDGTTPTSAWRARSATPRLRRFCMSERPTRNSADR